MSENDDLAGDQITEKMFTNLNHLMKLSLNNQLDEATSILKKLESDNSESIYYTLATVVIKFLDMVSLEPEKVSAAVECAKKCLKLINKYRPSTGMGFFKPNYNQFTDFQCHAELIHADCSLMLAIGSLLESQSFLAFINAALYMRAANKSYRMCFDIKKCKDNWDSDLLRMHFETGAQFGVGALELAVSFLPGRFISLLEYVGFGGSRDFGIRQLTMVATNEEVFRYPLASIILLVHLSYSEYLLGLGDSYQSLITKLFTRFEANFPESGYTNMFRGLLKIQEGKLTEAVTILDRCVKEKQLLYRVDTFCILLQYWSNVVMGDFEESMRLAALFEEANWAPATGTFVRGLSLFTLAEREPDLVKRSKMIEEVQQIMKGVRARKRNFGGKKAFHEKFTLDRSELYSKKPSLMVMPLYDYAYIFNYIKLFGRDMDHVRAIKDQFEERLSDLKSEDEHFYDKYAYLTFIKGLMQFQLSEFEAGTEALELVVSHQDNVTYNTHLAPQACYELGNHYRLQGKAAEAKKWLKKSLKFNNYDTHMMVSYRAELALNKLH